MLTSMRTSTAYTGLRYGSLTDGEIQGVGLTRGVERRLDRGFAVDLERDRPARGASRDRVGPDDVHAEADERLDPLRRRDAAPAGSDERLDLLPRRQALVLRVEHLAGVPDDRR